MGFCKWKENDCYKIHKKFQEHSTIFFFSFFLSFFFFFFFFFFFIRSKNKYCKVRWQQPPSTRNFDNLPRAVAYLGGCIACACTPGGHKGAPKSDQKGRQKEEEEKKRKERKGEKEEKGRGKGKEKEKRKEKETKKRKGDKTEGKGKKNKKKGDKWKQI